MKIVLFQNSLKRSPMSASAVSMLASEVCTFLPMAAFFSFLFLFHVKLFFVVLLGKCRYTQTHITPEENNLVPNIPKTLPRSTKSNIFNDKRMQSNC